MAIENLDKFLLDNGFRLDTYYGNHKYYVNYLNDAQSLEVEIFSPNEFVGVDYISKGSGKVNIEPVQTVEQLILFMQSLSIIPVKQQS